MALDCEGSERGAPARAVVEAAVREHFPADGPDRYTPEELARLNGSAAPQATRRLRFDPYAATAQQTIQCPPLPAGAGTRPRP
jgi:hypothetical protein